MAKDEAWFAWAAKRVAMGSKLACLAVVLGSVSCTPLPPEADSRNSTDAMSDASADGSADPDGSAKPSAGSCGGTGERRCAEGVCDTKARKCVECLKADDCAASGECQVRRCDEASHTCELESVDDGEACTGSFGAGRCRDGGCVECTSDDDCSGGTECEQAFCRASDNRCQRRPLPVGATCSGDRACNGSGECSECSSDVHCGSHATCVDNGCRCAPGFVANASGGGCNYDECAKFDDNQCGAQEGSGNRCNNTLDGYDCICGADWERTGKQCLQRGSGDSSRTVVNRAAWNAYPTFEIVCENAFDTSAPCASGQLTWIDLCRFPDANPADCASIIANPIGLGSVTLKRVQYSGALEGYGDSDPNGFGAKIANPAVGDVILVQTVAVLYVMRLLEVDATLKYDWAALWRDTCWRPGGPCASE